MSDIPKHILAQIPSMAAEGLSVGRMSFLLRIPKREIEAELQRLGLSVTTTGEESRPRLNTGSMTAETKHALARFEAVTGVTARRFKSNRHAMRFWFSVWVDRNDLLIQKALRDYPDQKSINGLPFDFLIDEDDEEVRFDIDREDLLK